jgi:SWI/SNF-related matrix-associated actin-dependent regulator 1 of chromatin subfamily A
VKIDVLDQLVAKTTILEKVAMTPSQQNVYQGILMSYAKRREDLKRKAASQLEADRMLDAKKKKTPSAAANGATENDTKTEEGAIDLTSSPSTDTTRTSIESATAAGEKGSDDAEDPVVRELSSSEMKHLFTALRKAANHPLLLRVKYQDEVVMNKIAEVSHAMEHFGNQCDLRRVREELDKFSDYDLHQLCMEYPAYLSEYIVPAEMLYNSPKLMRLKSLLPELISQGHRILVFSQWTRLLDLLEVFMNDNGFKFLRLDGSTPIKERQIRIDKFNGKGVPEEDLIPVFLLSTKAGGLGINLTAADTVVLHDLDFNPENDKQAEDRCHRIGQTKPVTVYKLVTEDTVDEDIYDIGERKSKLSSAVLSDYSKQTQEESAGVGGKKKSSAKNDDGGEVSEGDIGMIGRILQKALMKASSK